MKPSMFWIALALPCFGALSAQEGLASSELTDARRLLEERSREDLHPSETLLTLVGREQGENDLRSPTPALLQSDRVAARVDPEEAHARALALYEDGADFHAPPAPVKTRPERAGKSAPDKRASASPQAATEARAPWWHSALPGGLIGGLLLVLVYRGNSRNLRWKA